MLAWLGQAAYLTLEAVGTLTGERLHDCVKGADKRVQILCVREKRGLPLEDGADRLAIAGHSRV